MSLFRFMKLRPGFPQSYQKQRRKLTPIRRRPALEELESRVLMASGLVAAYNFAQGSGSVLTDISGNGNNGTINNATWTTVNSSSLPFTGALQFTGAANSMVNIANSSSINLTKGMTLEAWVNPSTLNNSSQGWEAAISKDHVNSGNDISYALYAANGTGTPPAVHILNSGLDDSVQGSSQLSLSTWTFLAATYDGSTLKMYVNGNLVSSQSLSGSITTTSDPLHIGGDWSGEMFTGSISNVRIYNTALSQSAIQTDMNTPVSTTDTPPTVTSVTPANNASNVSTGTGVTVQFSEALDPTTVTSSTVQLLNSSGSAVAASVSYNSSTDTATLTPSAALANSSTYTVLVHGGTTGAVIMDAADNPMTANFSSAFTTAAASAAEPFPNNQPAPPLPTPTGTVINVSTVSQLESAVANLQSGQTIMIASGTYNLTGTLYVPEGLTNIAIRGATGKAGDVVIQGDAVLDPTSPYNGSALWGTGSGISGSIPFGIWLGNVQGVTIGDLTLKNFVDDAIILNAGVQSPLIHNVVMLDTGEQLFKSNPDGSGGGVNNGVVEYCTIGYTSLAPNNYTNGIDLVTAQNWTIRNNLFQNIATTNPLTTATSGALAGPAILIWGADSGSGSKNCTVENNTFINCQREIAFGLSDPTTITDDNSGGIIENNFIYRSGTQHGDVAIGVWNSPNTEVAYNTVILNGDYVNAIEYRFATTTGVNILYNLTDAAITERTGATATVTGNVTSGVQSSWFVNESIGNLNLTSAATGAIGKGTYLPEVSTDYGGQARPSNGPTDVGADEYQAATDTAPTVMSVTPANNASNVSTGTAVTVQFSEALDPTTVTTSTIQLLNSSGSAVATSVSYNSSTDTATLMPSAALANNSTYTVLVHGGSSGAVIKDAADTSLAANFSSAFTTVVAPPPTPTGLTATAGSAQATLSWSASSGATSYNVYRSTTSGGEGSTPYKTGVTGTSFTDTGLTNGTTYYYEVSAVNAGGQSPVSAEVSAKPQAAGSLVQAIDAGGKASGSYSADADFSGGGTYANSDTINTSNVSNPASQSVYDSERNGDFSYTIGNLTPGAAYTVRLDFAEIYWNAAGKRIFNVAINGSSVLSNFDIYAAAGGKDIAIARSFSVTADASGQITIQFSTVRDNAKVSGIEIFSGSTAAPATPTGLTATAGNAQTTLNWSASPGATSYNVYRSTTSGGEGSTPYKTGVTGTSFTDTGLTNGTTYYYEVSAVNAGGQSPVSAEVSAQPVVLAIDAGGKASGSYSADADFSGGGTYANSDTINTSNVSNPASQSVYDSERNGDFSYTIGNLTPGAAYTVRLDFAEIYWNAAGKRIFNVAINGSSVLSNFDIYAAAGGKDIAIARSFSVTADANGQITIQFTTVRDNAKVSGIEILPAGTAPTVTGVTPANGATNTSLTGKVQLTFSEALNPATVNSSTVQLLGPSNSVVAAAVSYNSSTDTVTLTPSSALASNTTYTVLVQGGISSAVVMDALGDPLAANFTSSFTTDDPLAASAGPTESGKEGTAVQFSGSSIGGTGGSSYLWNFGDGTTATATLTPSHTYLTAGTYTVTLTATDNTNDTVKSTTTATVADVPPTANAGGPYSGTQGTAINFTGSGSVPDPKDTLSYSWNFGDGSASTLQDPSHSYAAAGSYNVTFTVTAADGVKTTATTTAAVSSTSGGSTPNEPLLFSQNLQYLGAFRVPNYYNSTDNISYGGTALAYDPANNGLFLVGKNQTIAEVSIPQSIVNSSNLDSLATATIVQPWTAVLSSLPNNTLISPYDIGGLMVNNGQLIGTLYEYYNGAASQQGSHFVLSSLNLSTAKVSGLYSVGSDYERLVAGYMTSIPSEWQASLGATALTGLNNVSIVSTSSSGPAAFGFNPANFGASPAPDTPYVYYTINAPLGPNEGPADPIESGTTQTGGVVFVPGTSSVLYFGASGINYDGYGATADYGDYVHGESAKGPLSLNGQYAYQVWAYNAADFAAVKQGLMQPGQVQPYDVWNFTPPIAGNYTVGGAAFDSSTGRLYVSILNADSEVQYSSLPLIEVYQLTMTPSSSSGPAAPQVGTLAVTTTKAAPSGSTSPYAPGPIASGTPVVLTAGNVYPVDLGVSTLAASLTITQVAFYLESNGTGVPNPSKDKLIGDGTASTIPDGEHNWTLTMSTAGLTSGSYTIYAMAKDSNGVWSVPTATTLQIA